MDAIWIERNARNAAGVAWKTRRLVDAMPVQEHVARLEADRELRRRYGDAGRCPRLVLLPAEDVRRCVCQMGPNSIEFARVGRLALTPARQ